MIQSISANSINLNEKTQYSSAKLSGTTTQAQNTSQAASAKKAAASVSLKNASNKIASSNEDEYGDTVTISSQGQSLETAAISNTDTTNSSSSSSTSTEDLSSYSDIELKEMLNNGEITQTEYNEEIASREASSTTSEAAITDSDSVDE